MPAGRPEGFDWVYIDTPLTFQEISATPSPVAEADTLKLYAKDNGSGVSQLCYQNDAGTEVCLPTSGTIVTGTGVANRVAFWSGTSTLSSDADLTFLTDTLTVTKEQVTNLGVGEAPSALRLGVTGANDTEFVRFTATNAVLSIKETVADSAAYFTLGTSGQTNVFVNIPESLIFNIDSDNNQTTRSLVIKKDTATSSGGTHLFTFFENGSFAVGSGADAGTSGFVLTSAGAAAAPTWSSAGHALLSATHTDTLASAVSRGSLIYGNSTPAWAELNVGSAGAFLRNDATDVMWSTLILPNAATANRVVYASASNTYGESADVTYDGTDFGIGSGKRFRMQSQNRTRYLNSMARAKKVTTAQTLTTDTVTAITLNSEADGFDTDTLHDTVTNNTRITAAIAGKYLIVGGAAWEAEATQTERLILLEINATTVLAQQRSVNEATRNPYQALCDVASLAAGDYVELYARHQHGADTDVLADTGTFLALIYLGE